MPAYLDDYVSVRLSISLSAVSHHAILYRYRVLV
jgi:hypothetical protein